MYEKKLPFDMDCGIRIAMEVIGGKWKSCIIFELREGCLRPNEIHKMFPEANPRVINKQLKELEMHGVIQKTIYPVLPPRSEYNLTELGESLLPIIEQIEQWGNSFRPQLAKIMGIE